MDPRLVLVLETSGALDDAKVRPADLRVLDASTESAVVAFSDDPGLAVFFERLAEFRGPDDNDDDERGRFEDFFGLITGVRRWGPGDRVTDRLRSVVTSLAPDDIVRVDIECWHPGTAAQAEAWMNETNAAIDSAGGSVVDTFESTHAQVAMIRADVPAQSVDDLAEVDLIRIVDALPQPTAWSHDPFEFSADDAPPTPEPAPGAPLVGLIDSGVAPAHALLGGLIAASIPVGGHFPDGADISGHGTAVAGVILFGSLEGMLAGEGLPAPFCRIVSVRVVESDARIADGVLLESEISDALDICAAEGVSIVNLSIGDQQTPYGGRRATRLAGIVDAKAKQHGLVVVISAGNVEPADYFHPWGATVTSDYPLCMAADKSAPILDPAPAALALTVGGTVLYEQASTVGRTAIGQSGWPAPITRHGPGIRNAVKPELVAPSGTFAWDHGTGVLVSDDQLAPVHINGRIGDTALLGRDVGTSFAAGAVTRIAAAVRTRYPGAGPNLTRALVLQSASPVAESYLPAGSMTPNKVRLEACRSLVGYGRARLSEALDSSSHRAVLLAEADIASDGVDLYEVPIPSSFYEAGGWRQVSTSLAYDPDTRGRRVDYLSSTMAFYLFRGMSIEDVREVVARTEPEDDVEDADEDAEELLDTEDETDAADAQGEAPRRSQVGRAEVKLQPSATVRGRGTNQLGRRRLGRLKRETDGESFIVAVVNRYQWGPRTAQPYAITMTIERDENHGEVYAELRAALEARQQVELEARARS